MEESRALSAPSLKGETVVIAASGGLDSCTITRWLSDQGVRVVCCTLDLGQPDEDGFDNIEARLLSAGAAEVVILPAVEPLLRAGMQVLQSQAWYEGRYWNTTGIARYVLVSAVVKYMEKHGYTIFSHGATGRGNDQVRFQLATNMIAPHISVYAPWRDPAFLAEFRGRAEMIDFCQQRNIPITASKSKPYSTDANLLGLTHEAGILEYLETPPSAISPIMGSHPTEAPNEPETISVTFEQGLPVSLNGKPMVLRELFEMSNSIAGRHGVGIATHLVENRFVGIKSRGVYEAPGMELLGSCYGFLLELILDRRSREFFDVVSRQIAKQIYQGYWFDLATTMALGAIAPVTKRVSGTITVSLFKGSVRYASVADITHSLYDAEQSSMESVGSFDHADSEGFLRVLGISARAVAHAKQVRSDAE